MEEQKRFCRTWTRRIGLASLASLVGVALIVLAISFFSSQATVSASIAPVAIDVYWVGNIMTLTQYVGLGEESVGDVWTTEKPGFGTTYKWDGEWQLIRSTPTKIYQRSQLVGVWADQVWWSSTVSTSLWSSTGWGEWQPETGGKGITRTNRADLAISVWVPEAVIAGEWFSVVFQVENLGPSATTSWNQLLFTDTQEISFDWDTSRDFCTFWPDRQEIFCQQAILAGQVFTYPVQIRAGTQLMTLSGRIRSYARPDLVSGDNLVTATVGVSLPPPPPPGGDLTMAGAILAQYEVGEPRDYSLTVGNNGPEAKGGIILTSVIPSSLTFGSAHVIHHTSGDKWGNCYAGDVVTCSIGALWPGQSVGISLGITPTAVGEVAIFNEVSGWGFDPILGNNALTLTTVVVDPPPPPVPTMPDLAIYKAVVLTTVVVGQDITYTVIFTNRGPSTTNVWMTDTLPSGTGEPSVLEIATTSEVTGTAVYYSEASHQLSVWLANLGDSGHARIKFVVVPSITGTITNTATVESDGIDFDPSNNISTVTTTVVAMPTLTCIYLPLVVRSH